MSEDTGGRVAGAELDADCADRIVESEDVDG